MAQRSRQNKKWNIIKLNDMQTFFAVDLGATSGRTIVGRLGQGNIELEEINRFPNHIIQVGKHYFWDIYALYNNIIEGLKIVAQKGIQIDSIGIDTWGVDFGLLEACVRLVADHVTAHVDLNIALIIAQVGKACLAHYALGH